MISARLIKVFFLFMIPGIIILRILDLKVVKPTQFCVNISFLKRLCVLRHPRPFYLIQLIRIRSLFLRKLLNSLSIILFETFVKENLVEGLVLVVVFGRRDMVAFIP